MKDWKDVKPGDVIYYYDHFKMVPQVVKSAEIKECARTYKRGNSIITEKNKYLFIEAGRSKMRLSSYCFGSTRAWHKQIRRFSCKEAAQKFLKNLTDMRIEKVKELDAKLTRQMNILAKYEISNSSLNS